jgi:hypothetical protein
LLAPRCDRILPPGDALFGVLLHVAIERPNHAAAVSVDEMAAITLTIGSGRDHVTPIQRAGRRRHFASVMGKD